MEINEIDVFLLNAFTKDEKGGNPAGVVLNANSLNSAQMQEIATQVNVPETVFVSPKNMSQAEKKADFEVRFYTPTQEVDFCGHASVAAFTFLYQKGVICSGCYYQSTKLGILPVWINDEGLVTLEQSNVSYHQQFNWQQIRPLIDLDGHAQAISDLPIEVVSTGLKDCFIPLVKGSLDKLKFDLDGIAVFCKRHDLISFHLFEMAQDQSGLTKVECRNIAPLVGIDEEAATGSSAGALTCYLNRYLKDKPTEFVFQQGRKMGSLSQIYSKLVPTIHHQNTINQRSEYRIHVSGYAHLNGHLVISF